MFSLILLFIYKMLKFIYYIVIDAKILIEIQTNQYNKFIKK
jgi:hypothetical protein